MMFIKTKRIQFVMLAFLAVILFLAASCNKKDDEKADPETCTGPAQLSISGAVNGTYCLTEVTNFVYNDHIRINIVSTNGDGESVMLFASVGNPGEGLNPGTGTFQCGGDEEGFVQVGFHGAVEEFFNSTSGTLTITEINENSLKASFNVTSKGYYDEEVVTVNGTINY